KNWENWGLCRDEFVDNGGWPRRLYIRSARRLVSDYVITEHHTRRDNDNWVEDPVAIAWWPPDTHHARRIVKDGYAYNEGFVFGGDDWRPFGISWRSLIPKQEECTNLITPTCLSSSYVAYGAIRIVPTFMILGQSAGCAASMAIDQQIAVQDLDYHELRNMLNDQGQILTIPEDWLRFVLSED
ncbi:MAG: FAD-dependent oxidoreductase, partial [Cyclobacteriaceae bacterium]|nr:FAD-dependent oxidoreductase [Cyclobacteriaceae bacterium]